MNKQKIKSFTIESPNKYIRYFFGKIHLFITSSKIVQFFRFHYLMNDEKYIKKTYKKRFNDYLDLESPTTFNEKNNWRKIHDRRNIYTCMVDKYRMKEFVSKKLNFNEHTVPLLGVWDNPNKIDFDKLPSQFVLKTNHSGGIIACKNKNDFDKKRSVKELKRAMKIDYFFMSREWPYKNVPRKIIAEEYMGENLIDYKNYCFDGKLSYTFVWTNSSKADGRKPNAFFLGAYDAKWERSEISISYPSLDQDVEKPQSYDEMKKIVEKLSQGIPFVRVDCYIINGHVYVGEFTFFPWGGWMKFNDVKFDFLLGNLEQLPKSN